MHKIHVFSKIRLICTWKCKHPLKSFLLLPKVASIICSINRHLVHTVGSAKIKTLHLGKRKKFHCRFYLMSNSCRERNLLQLHPSKEWKIEGGTLRPHEQFAAKNKTKVKTQNVIFNIMKEIFKGNMLLHLLFTY